MPMSTSQQTILESQVLVGRADGMRTSVLEQWHNEHHPGVYRFCGELPEAPLTMGDTCPTCGRMYRGQHYDRAQDLVDEIEMLLGAGESAYQIARRFGIAPNSVARRLVRWGRADLARPFWRADWLERRNRHRRLQEAS